MEQDHEFLRRSSERTRSETTQLDSMKRPLDPVKPARVQVLETSLKKGDYECRICKEYVGQEDGIWRCNKCFNMLHLGCAREWARFKRTRWTCPMCREPQATAADALHSSYCFCTRAVRNPPPNPDHTPHTCGGRCNKPGSCPHTQQCALACHPGPCPPCNQAQISCPCGKKEAQCPTLGSCGQPCGKRLACGRHNCAQTCHEGACEPCLNPCGKLLACGRHNCAQTCREGTCAATCQQPCGKLLPCGRHACPFTCHPPGRCKPHCSERVDHPCQCGASSREDDCRLRGEVYWCKRKRCQKMRALS